MRNRVEQNTLLNRLVAVPFYLKLLREKNTIEAEYEALRDNVEDELFSEKEKIITLEARIASQQKTISNLKEKLREERNANIQRNNKARQRKSQR